LAWCGGGRRVVFKRSQVFQSARRTPYADGSARVRKCAVRVRGIGRSTLLRSRVRRRKSARQGWLQRGVGTGDGSSGIIPWLGSRSAIGPSLSYTAKPLQ